MLGVATQYFQDPSTGQIFVGDPANVSSYIQNGFIPVNTGLDMGLSNMYNPLSALPLQMSLPQMMQPQLQLPLLQQQQELQNLLLLQQLQAQQTQMQSSSAALLNPH